MDTILEDRYNFALSFGRPVHDQYDDFSLRHPKMPMNQRAKIFSPFSALKGFDEIIDRQFRYYAKKRELNDEEQENLNRVLIQLYNLTRNSHLAKEYLIIATVTYCIPCEDENHEAYGRLGTYERITGTVWNIDPVLRKVIRIGDNVIDFADITEIIVHDKE